MDEETKQLLKQVLELFTDRTEDLFDEEGIPTQELVELTKKIENKLDEAEGS